MIADARPAGELPPFIVLDAEAVASVATQDLLLASLPDGWSLREGLSLPDEPWDLAEHRWACIAIIHGAKDARDAIVAGTRGVRLVLDVRLDGEARRHFLEDLHRLGAVGDALPAAGPSKAQPSALTNDQARLLDLLVSGQTVTAAAADLHVSRRTANRWLAEARAALGVVSTAAALTRWSSARQPGPR